MTKAAVDQAIRRQNNVALSKRIGKPIVTISISRPGLRRLRTLCGAVAAV
jgi:hypothetical protein